MDCWPLFLLVPEARTINFGIDLGTRVKLVPGTDRQVTLEMSGLGYKKSFPTLSDLLGSGDSELALIRPVLHHFRPTTGFSLSLSSQSPVGGGLGGSSSLLIGMIRAFSDWKGEMLSGSEMVRLACNLETRVLKKPAGTQDYISALEGGLNVIHYGDRGPEWTTGGSVADEFNQRFFLVDTGQPHHSGLNNWDVIKRALDGDQKVLSALKDLAELSLDFERALLNSDWREFAQLFAREITARLALSPSFSSPEIELLQKKLKGRTGAALKICGAGGGGCVMVWGEPADMQGLKSLIHSEGFHLLDAKFWARESLSHGAS